MFLDVSLYLIVSQDLCFLLVIVLERPSSQMSYLDQFLKETNSVQHHQGSIQDHPYQNISVELDDGDMQDIQALSVTSSKSNLSELSLVLTLR